MYEVLVCVDRNEKRARAAARTVAEMPLDREETRASVLHVFGENPSGASVNQVAAARRADEVLSEAGYDVEFLETSGDPAVEIVDTAEEEDVDLVVVSGRERSPTGKLLFGSTTQEVLLDLDRPVLTAKPLDGEG